MGTRCQALLCHTRVCEEEPVRLFPCLPAALLGLEFAASPEDKAMVMRHSSAPSILPREAHRLLFPFSFPKYTKFRTHALRQEYAVPASTEDEAWALTPCELITSAAPPAPSALRVPCRLQITRRHPALPNGALQQLSAPLEKRRLLQHPRSILTVNPGAAMGACNKNCPEQLRQEVTHGHRAGAVRRVQVQEDTHSPAGCRAERQGAAPWWICFPSQISPTWKGALC